LVHSNDELLVADFSLLPFVFLLLFSLFLLQEHIERCFNVLILLEKTTASQCLDFSLRGFVRQILVLLLSHSFSYSVGHQVGWQVSQTGIVADSKALLDRVLLFVCEVV